MAFGIAASAAATYFGASAATAGLIGAGASLVGGALTSSGSASSAEGQQSSATDAAIAEQRRQYDLTRSDYAPYRAAGTGALSQLMSEMGVRSSNDLSGLPIMGGAFSGGPQTSQQSDVGDVMNDPGYKFGLQQGQLGLDRKAAASGGRVSGAALKAASEYATNYATTGYNAAYQRRQDRLNRLAALANVGQSSTGASATAGAGSANAISALTSAQGNASGAATLAQGNIWGNAVNQLGAAATKWATAPKASNTSTGGYPGMDTSSYTYG